MAKKRKRAKPRRRAVHHPKRRIFRSKKSTARRRRAIAPKPPSTENAQSEQLEAPREVRVRLDAGERELLVAAVLAQLPKIVQKADREDKTWELDWKLREKYKVQRSLIQRLRAPRRGHPSTW